MMQQLSGDDVNDFVYKLLLIMQGTMQRENRFRFKLFGQYMCRNGFKVCIGMENGELTRLQNLVKQGHMEYPRDLRHTSAAERCRARRECDAALQWAYDILAKPEPINSSDVRPAEQDVDANAPELKMPDDDAADPTFLAMPTLDGYCEWVHGPGATVASDSAQADARKVRWLPPMPLIDLLDICKDRMKSKVSYSMFFHAYNETWQHRLRFRQKSCSPSVMIASTSGG